MSFPKYILIGIAAAIGFGLTGCGQTFTNLTPSRVAQNDSHIYSFSFTANLSDPNVVQETVRASIVIDGEQYRMERDPDGSPHFRFDYQFPPGQRRALYYYVLEYETIKNNVRREVTRTSVYGDEDPHQIRVVNRYPIQLVTTRGPVGASVNLVGRGFSEHDQVVFGDREASTTFESSSSLRFTVPSVPADSSYPVSLRTGAADLPAGSFRVDSASFSVLPETMELGVGERQVMIIRTSFPAPSGGLPVDVTTDVPDSIIMPEVTIPQGARTVNVTVEGGDPGSGTLYVEAPGFRTTEVPVTVY